MRTDRSSGANSRTLVDAKMSLSLWLRAGRAQKGLSLEAVAKITKIQPRILERLEAGKLDGLPAEVFVRGFVRSFARCVGLDEAEALERYSLAAAATTSSASGQNASVARAGALIESMSELAPATARSPKLLRREPEVIDVAPIVIEEAPPVVETPPVEMMLPESGTLVMDAPIEAPIEAPPVIAEPPVVVDAVATSVLEAAAAASTPELSVAVSTAPEVVDAVIAAEVAAVEAVQLGLEAVATVEPSSKKKRKRGGKRSKRASLAPQAAPAPRASASGTPAQPTPVVVEAEAEAIAAQLALAEAVRDVALAAGSLSEATVEAPTAVDLAGAVAVADASETGDASETADTTASEPWTPRMPTVVAPTVPWRRATGAMTSTAAAPVVPSLVIDDADPDSAERELEDRQAAKEPARRSFLPPILLDREDRSARQGGLTLAVIILLIAATLTLSYLMRRPSSTGDGVTQREAAAQHHASIA